MKSKIIAQIKEFISEKEITRPKDIEKEFKLSQSTCRRILINLEAENFIKRNFGEIILEKGVINFSKDTIAIKAIKENVDVKKALAKRGALLAKNYEVIFVDASSCNFYLFNYLENKAVQIYTNSLINAKRAIDKGFFNISIISGKIKPRTFSIISNSDEFFEKICFPISFVGVNSINSDNDFLTPEILEGKSKRRILDNSNLAVFLVEKEKFNTTSFYNFSSNKCRNIVITNLERKWDPKKRYELIRVETK